MARRTLQLAVALVGGVWAGEAARAPGRVDAVTLYRGQAEVTRSMPAPAGVGTMEIVVAELPERIVADSLHADGGEGVQIRAVRYRERALSEEPREEVRKIDEQLAANERSLRENQQAQDVAKRKQTYLDKLGTVTAEAAGGEVRKGLLQPDELTKITAFFFQQHDALSTQLLELGEAGRKLADEQALLRRRRASLTQTESRTAREAILFIEKQKPGAAEIRLVYLVRGVEWTPSYNLRAAQGRPEVELEYNASIQQMSGEEWQGVKLTLSTAAPTLSAEPPTLTPFRVTLETALESKTAHEVLRVERERLGAEEQFRAAQTDEMRQQAEAAANAAAARLQALYFRGGPKAEEVVPLDTKERPTAALSVTYPLPDRQSIESRSDLQTLRIALLKLNAEVYRVAEPALTRYAYRQAQLTNTSDLVLLQGKVDAYLDGKFAGTGSIPLVRPGQRFTAGLGVDTRLLAKQRLLFRDESVMGGNKELALTYEILLENFGDQPIPLRVLDRIPVPAEGRIYVTLGDTRPPLSKDPAYERFQKPQNILRWDIEVPAKSTEDKAYGLQYKYSVKFDKTLQIDAGRTIAPFFALARPLEPWKVEESWSKDETKLSLETGKPGDPERIILTLARGSAGKNVIGRRVEADLAGCRWLIVDLENQIPAGTRLAIGLSAGREWKYFESAPNYVRQGDNPNVVFDLTAPNFKAESTRWEYTARPERLDDVRALYLVFYPIADGTVVVRELKLAK
jgi:uncharacterized protein (TIGR02231 family)